MNLSQLSGLPMNLNADGSLSFGDEIRIDESKTRVLDELTPVYLDPAACRGSDVAYWMYNGVYAAADQPRFSQAHIRYELTLFPDKCIGREYVKAHGHVHIPEPNSGIQYPEICEVLAGTAHFFFQNLDPSGPSSSEAFCVEVKAGQKIVVPPGYDHLTINPGPGPMLFSDVVALTCGGIYDRFKRTGGAAYLEVEQAGKPVFIPNPHYAAVPALRMAVPREFPALDLSSDRPLYSAFRENAGENWPFLWRPEVFQPAFPSLDELFLFSTIRRPA
jgi:glucose-6-phosphate isomerase, archaeal